MDKNNVTRRQFLAAASVSTVSAVASGGVHLYSKNGGMPAILGGQPVRTKPFPSWPIWDDSDERTILPVLRSGVWSREQVVTKAEEMIARLMGSKYCLATTNGTSALITSLFGLGVGGGDEVITTPYTFVATVDAILVANALPVFVDIDPQTWQIDPDKIEQRITKNTVAILPVHITGGVCQMDKINAIAKRHGLKVIEDACEAHLAEWRHKNVGTLGDLGCLSFQNGKSLTCGEGGAVLGDDEKLMDLCYSIHNFGRPKGKYMPRDRGGHPIFGAKFRMAEYQASILISQMDHLEEQTKRRSENADYLTSKIREIPGIVPRKDYPETTRTSYYYYGFRYKAERFNGLSRQKFMAALRAEGVPSSWGLGVIEGAPMNREGVIEQTLNSKTFQRIYSKTRLDEYRQQNNCPESDRLCEETVGFHGRMLLGPKKDMDDIYDAILKIYENRAKLT